LLPPDLVTHSIARPLPPETIGALGEMGYRAVPHDWDFGDVQLVQRSGNAWIPASDPRGRGESRVVRLPDKGAERAPSP
jgi:gamma-glutamyltranspeptidase/glutathione hydrolase